MNALLQFISISHKTASVKQREDFHVFEEEKSDLVNLICKTYPDIKGLLLLSTCNRTEIYFESNAISATTMRNFFIDYKAKESIKERQQLFRYSNNTEDTITHLLQVSSGLESLVLGDAEIIHQIKKAYQFSMDHQLQGSLLERALQTAFKIHKRISNETDFRDGTTSVAYKSLKVIRDSFDKATVKSKKILFVGAGDIVKQLFKYNAKFKFNNVYISNRSEDKAINLANRFSCRVYDWNKVLENDFEGFDVIISAVSNCPQLIKNVPSRASKTLLIDLAMPNNINKTLRQFENFKLFDLDSISIELEDTKAKRLAALNKVNNIINEEIPVYLDWLQSAPLRSFLAEYKIVINEKVKDYFKGEKDENMEQKVNSVTNQVMRKLMAETEALKSLSKIDAIIFEQTSLLK
jgi:glutamyl-tRNA reductase